MMPPPPSLLQIILKTLYAEGDSFCWSGHSLTGVYDTRGFCYTPHYHRTLDPWRPGPAR